MMTRIAQYLEVIAASIFQRIAQIGQPFSHLLGVLVLVVFAATVTVVSLVYPNPDWDMFGYTAVTLEPHLADKVELHDRSYQLVQDAISPGKFITLTQDRGYRLRQFQDPEAFSTMLGIYRLKAGYIWILRTLNRITDPVTAIRLVSAFSAGATALLLLFWLARANALSYGPVVVAILMLTGFGHMALSQTPDMLSSFCMLLGACLYYEKLDILAGLALIASVFIRPDTFAFVGVIFVFALIYGQARLVMTLTFLLSIAAYVIAVSGKGYPGWWVFMWFSNVEYVPTLKDFHPPFSLLIYVKVFVRAIVRALVSQTWPAMLFLLATFFVRAVRPEDLAPRARVLLYGTFVAIAAKYVVFPHFENRMYLPSLVIMAMVLLLAWVRQQKSETAGLSPPLNA